MQNQILFPYVNCCEFLFYCFFLDLLVPVPAILNAGLVTMLSTELFVWLWISKIQLIINDGHKMTALCAETPA